MAKCVRCGKSGVFFKVNSLGICSECEIKDLKSKIDEQAKEIKLLNSRNKFLQKTIDEKLIDNNQCNFSEQYVSTSANEKKSESSDYTSDALIISKAGNKRVYQNNIDCSLNLYNDFTVIDIETTGLSISLDYIVEISSVKVRNNKIIDTFTSYIKPPIPIPQKATVIHGITNEMVKSAPSSLEVMQEWLNFIGDDVIIGHNIEKFDLPMVKRFAYLNNSYADTLKLSKCCGLEAVNHKLHTLCSLFGIVNERAHNSLSDCIATYELYLKLKEARYDVTHSITTTLVSGTKLSQYNIAKCQIGNELNYHCNEKSKVEIFKGDAIIGYLSHAAETDFRFNVTSVDKIILLSISEVTKGKSVRIKIFLNQEYKRYFTEQFDLISTKAINQDILSKLSVGCHAVIKQISDKFYFFINDNQVDYEIGYAPKCNSAVLNKIGTYMSQVVNIKQENNRLKVTVRVDYCCNESNDLNSNLLNVYEQLY